MTSSTPATLAAAVIESVTAGARVLNISAALVGGSFKGEAELGQAFEYARRREAIVVAAAGNQAMVGATAITAHPWVIPVVAYDRQGRPARLSNLGGSIGRRGLGAPGDGVVSLVPPSGTARSGGTSVAAAFVTGAIALLWSAFPDVGAAQLRLAALEASASRRKSVVPPMLDAWGAYQVLARSRRRS